MTDSTDINRAVRDLGEAMWSSCAGLHQDVIASAALNILANVALKSTNRDKVRAEIMMRLLLEQAIAQLQRHGENVQ